MAYNRLLVVCILIAPSSISANAQSSQSYNEFLKGARERYDEFHNSIYENYAKFLEGEWVEIKVNQGEKKNEKPKPKDVPRAEPEEIVVPAVVIETPEPPCLTPTPVAVGVPDPSMTPHPIDLKFIKTPTKPVSEADHVIETISSPKPIKNSMTIPERPKPKVEPAQMEVPNAKPEQPMNPDVNYVLPNLPWEQEEKPKLTDIPIQMTEFDFYGIKLQIPQIELDIRNSISHKSELAEQWRELDTKEGAGKLINEMAALRSTIGLNDYLTMQALLKYVASQYTDSDATSRLSLCHYVMSHLGYDIRFGLSKSGIPLLMVPFQQKVYAHTFLYVNGNERYYLFTENDTLLNLGEDNVYTCEIPKDIKCGGKINLRIETPLNIPEKPHEFCVEYGGLKLKGKANANIYPLVYNYPQMEISEYAASQLMPDLRKDLVVQLKTQLSGLSKEDAINKLLRLIQKGFDYATDQDQFGFEKVYFLEETFFYPKCDCEDRAILYSYLLWNALEVETHIINYPGHEATAVNLEGDGDNYIYNGKCFQISDPTYIGANTGKSMPCYKEMKPTIDFIYSNR